MDDSGAGHRKSYWKTIVVATGTSLLALAAAVSLPLTGVSAPGWLLSGSAVLLALLAGCVAAGGFICVRREVNQERGVGWVPRARTTQPRSHPTDPGSAGRDLRVGDWVEVRSAREILASLDAEGALDALPFMPEMLAHCGTRLLVTQCADKILDMIDKTGHRLRRMRDAVLLDDVRCDGSAHGGCQQGCKIIWKTAWLRRVEAGGSAPEHAAETTTAAREELLPFTRRTGPEGGDDPPYHCQATELRRASAAMHAWDPRPELRALTTGNIRLADFVLVLLVRAFNFAQWLRGGVGFPAYQTQCRGRTPHERLDLRPGEWVEVKSLREIGATLDEQGRNRGMRFDRDMVRFCGGRYRVRGRVDRLIDERSGRMRRLGNPCIILEGVEATGEFLRFNPQREYPYWREIWLRRSDRARD